MTDFDTSDEGNYGSYLVALADGDKAISPVKPCAAIESIRGTVQANQTGKLRIKQGAEEGNLDYETVINIVSSTPIGFMVACVGLFCQIEVENDSGSAMTYTRFGWRLNPVMN